MAPIPVLSPATSPICLAPWEQVCMGTQASGVGNLAPAMAGVGHHLPGTEDQPGDLRHWGP